VIIIVLLQLLAIVGEQFQVGDEICGIVCSIRFNEDILSVWNKSADNKQARLKIQYVHFVLCSCRRLRETLAAPQLPAPANGHHRAHAHVRMVITTAKRSKRCSTCRPTHQWSISATTTRSGTTRPSATLTSTDDPGGRCLQPHISRTHNTRGCAFSHVLLCAEAVSLASRQRPQAKMEPTRSLQGEQLAFVLP
jgi:hypothetical protein